MLGVYRRYLGKKILTLPSPDLFSTHISPSRGKLGTDPELLAVEVDDVTGAPELGPAWKPGGGTEKFGGGIPGGGSIGGRCN
jgi:hypothetical protein